jgi:hypothetical protein
VKAQGARAVRLTAKDLKYATTCWELAQIREPVTLEVFGRISGSKGNDKAWKQAWARFRRWAIGHGVECSMEGSAASYDRAAMSALASRIRLSPRSRNMGPRSATKPNAPQRSEGQKFMAKPIGKHDERITTKQAARMIGIAEWTLRAWLRRPQPPFPVLHAGRLRTLRLSDVVAWIEANTVGGGTPAITPSAGASGKKV